MCERWSYWFPDAEHDVWPVDGAAAQTGGPGQEDRSSGGEAGLRPSLCPVATCCAFSSNNQVTKRLSGWAGLQGPLPVILFEPWVLFRPCQAALCRAQHTRDPMQFIKLTLQLWPLYETFLRAHIGCSVSHLYSYTIQPWQSGLPTVTDQPE